MFSCRKMILLALVLVAATARGAEPFAIRPSATDPRVTEFDSNHLAWLPEAKARNQLLLFLPGTGGTPENALPRAFEVTAARLGYHVIALMYPDNISAQRVCARSADPEAYLKFRNAIISGGAVAPRRTIGRHDSIESRLEKLLVYLSSRQPGSGWSQFVDPRGGVRWNLVAAAGQSQGGGHCYVLAKNHELARVVMFGSPKDYSLRFDAPAKGFDADTKTPIKRFFAYNHQRDNGNGCTHEQQAKILKKIGLTDLGVASADRPPRAYGHAHVLYTDVDLQDTTKFHGAGLNGRLQANPPAWKYMLTEPVE